MGWSSRIGVVQLRTVAIALRAGWGRDVKSCWSLPGGWRARGWIHYDMDHLDA